ncbi:AraC family transcriptional regulator [Aquimarina sp. D1M17]|uniref:AraC family transcriptional regulator n=1 Tax=Aquimarina acroporae TaxID=2937283 RepID=UPI0020C03746|nr:AraC family transcriptional regulator [Aquimarina acroporae]MCK8523929.1 AraC family transcriptional regulator [Aquimarina acroporae]
MKIAYEQIYLDRSTSLKIETYTDKSQCGIVSWHLHPEYELVFIQSGKGSIQIETHFENYEDGLLVFLGPNMPHMPFGNKETNNTIEVVAQFSERFVQEKLALFPEFEKLLKFIETSKRGIIFSKKTHKKVAKNFLKFAKQNKTEKLLNFINILDTLSNCEEPRKILKNKHTLDLSKLSIERFSKIYTYINDHYDQEIRSETLAQHIGLTPNSFCRMFKRVTNRNFIDFLNEFRIKKAEEYFNHQDITISEVMYKCGFNDPSYFSKQFKKYNNQSPSRYLRQLKQERSLEV